MHGMFRKEQYDPFIEGSASSADAVVPELLTRFGPINSVIDVGCGPGVWLDAFRRYGVKHYFGLDGAPVIPALRIPRERFQATDLKDLTDDGTIYDLACCLEVGEHLPESNSRNLIAFLCRKAPIVVFSAAIPGQKGDGHINTQWQEYWRKLFWTEGYSPFDIRQLFWGDKRVCPWYQQNMIIYVSRERLPEGYNAPLSLDIIHPATVNLSGREAVQILLRKMAKLARLSR